MEQSPQKAWSGKTGGTGWMQRSLSVLLRHLDIRVLYGIMALVIPFYMLFAHKGYIAIYRFFRERLGYGPLKAFLNVYMNHYTFGQVILDRFSFYAGNKYDLEIDGMEHWQKLNSSDSGFVQLSSHLGNYEMAGYTLRSERKMMYALVYSGETETVMKNRTASFEGNNIGMIPVSSDLSHMIRMNSELADGNIVSISADRMFGSAKAVECDFLGSKARFPQGPFALAVARGVPVVCVFVVKTSTKGYKAYVRPIEAKTTGTRAEKIDSLAGEFVKELETLTRQYPRQWFNFFDFWKQ